jgi:hypothetical protein
MYMPEHVRQPVNLQVCLTVAESNINILSFSDHGNIKIVLWTQKVMADISNILTRFLFGWKDHLVP